MGEEKTIVLEVIALLGFEELDVSNGCDPF